jgi:hypothetical protein
MLLTVGRRQRFSLVVLQHAGAWSIAQQLRCHSAFALTCCSLSRYPARAAAFALWDQSVTIQRRWLRIMYYVLYVSILYVSIIQYRYNTQYTRIIPVPAGIQPCFSFWPRPPPVPDTDTPHTGTHTHTIDTNRYIIIRNWCKCAYVPTAYCRGMWPPASSRSSGRRSPDLTPLTPI